MTKAFKQWKVLPHGKLKQIEDNILTVTRDIHMPLMDLPRRMTVVRLNDSRLAFAETRGNWAQTNIFSQRGLEQCRAGCYAALNNVLRVIPC
jgi:hypothetical protein